MKSFIKDPDADLDYTIDWSDWLSGGEQLSTSVWSISTTDVLSPLTKHDPSNTSVLATIWLAGGALQQSYIVTNEITTNSTPSRTEERSFMIVMRVR